MSDGPTNVRRDDRGRLQVLAADDVAALPWQPLRDLEGVVQKVLWQSGDVVIGLIRVGAGVEKPAHVHLAAHHHIWLVSGSCSMLGRELSAGAYVHIPPGVAHEVTGVGPEGCVYFYTHRPHDVPLAEAQVAGEAGSAE